MRGIYLQLSSSSIIPSHFNAVSKHVCFTNAPQHAPSDFHWVCRLPELNGHLLIAFYANVRTLRSPCVVANLSVCNVRATQTVELFSNILHRLIAYGLAQFTLKFWGKNQMSYSWPCKLNRRGYEKMTFFDQYLAFFRQELSYRKQIVRQLRTQYAEGIYDNPVTLKSRLTVTQGHRKWNHWVDHRRLTILWFKKTRQLWRTITATQFSRF